MQSSLRSPAILLACLLVGGSSTARSQSVQPSSRSQPNLYRKFKFWSSCPVPYGLLRMAGVSQKASEREVVAQWRATSMCKAMKAGNPAVGRLSF
jgi:hypothetical protein